VRQRPAGEPDDRSRRAGASSVRTTPRRATKRSSAAAARTAYCQVSVSAAARGTAVPRIAPIAAGPAPFRKLASASVRSRSNRADQDERERR